MTEDVKCAVCGLREVVEPDELLTIKIHRSCAESLAANIPAKAGLRILAAIRENGPK